MMKTHLVLLRGINVGGNKKVPMAELRVFIEGLGFAQARTVLQSGNLVFQSDGSRDDATLETFLEAQAAKLLDLNTTFLVRSAGEWAEVIARNPFPEAAENIPNHLVVLFLRKPPAAQAMENLLTMAVGDERLHLDGRHLYGVFAAGIGASKLAAAMMSPKFHQHASGRNWNTVLKMATLAAA